MSILQEESSFLEVLEIVMQGEVTEECKKLQRMEPRGYEVRTNKQLKVGFSSMMTRTINEKGPYEGFS